MGSNELPLCFFVGFLINKFALDDDDAGAVAAGSRPQRYGSGRMANQS